MKILSNPTFKKVLIIVVIFIALMLCWSLIKTIFQHSSKKSSESVFFSNPIDAMIQKEINEENITKGYGNLPQSWLLWVNLKTMGYNYGSKKTILSKSGVQTPRIEISPKTNSLEVSVSKEEGGTNVILPNAVTVNNWTHIGVTISDKFMEVYINGKLTKTKEISGSVNVDKSDVIISENSGFKGQIKKLRFFNKRLSADVINKIYNSDKPKKESAVFSWLKQTLEPAFSEKIPKNKDTSKTDPVCPPCELSDIDDKN